MNHQPSRIWRESQKLNSFLGKTGKVLTFSTIYSAPMGFEYQVPYHVAIVNLSSGENLTCQITDCSKKELRVGMQVQTVIRRNDQSEPSELIEYTIKVKPLK